MTEFFELFPVICGIILGLLLTRLRTWPDRAAAWTAGSTALGLLATTLSGEWRLGWEYLLFDIPVVAIAAAIANAVPWGWARTRSEPT